MSSNHIIFLITCILLGITVFIIYRKQQISYLNFYIYAYPLVLTQITKIITLHEFKSQVNTFMHLRELLDPKFRYVIRPNCDTLYSNAWLNLDDEPIVLSVGNTNGRYYLLPLLDAWTNVFASIGKRTTGTEANQFLICGPKWKHYNDNNFNYRIQSPTNSVWILGRVECFGPSDYKIVHSIQDSFQLTTLSKWYSGSDGSVKSESSKTSSNGSVKSDSANGGSVQTNPAKVLMKLPPNTFNHMYFDTVYANNSKSLYSAKTISNINYNTQVKLTKKAHQLLMNKSLTIGNKINGWDYLTSIGTYGKNYLTRAVVAWSVLGANLPEDAIYYNCYIDNETKPLNGLNNYVLNFATTPPCKAFWSITVYDEHGFLIPNSLNRYSLSSRDNIVNADGSLFIYLQHDSPLDTDSITKWIPIPSQKFNVMLRIYWPDKRVSLIITHITNHSTYTTSYIQYY